MNFINLIEDNYNIKVSELSLSDAHFGTEIYLLKTSDGNKYFVKKLPLYMEDVKNENDITDFLRSKGIGVPVLLKTKDGSGVLISLVYPFACNLIARHFISSKAKTSFDQ